MKKSIIGLFLCAAWIPSCIFAQSSLLGKMAEQLYLYPKEKVHLHIDRGMYLPGDTVWFSAYVVHSTFHTPSRLSQYLYVDLVDPLGEMVGKVKVKENKDGRFHGCLPLSLYMPAGYYGLRAYTRYMASDSLSIPFIRKLPVLLSPEWNGTRTDMVLEAKGKGKTEARIRLTDISTGNPVPIDESSIRLEDGLEMKARTKKTDGLVRATLEKGGLDRRSMLLIVTDRYDRTYQRYLPFSTGEQDYQVEFYPEGGHLRAGDSCRVAFRTWDRSGNATGIRYVLKDGEGTSLLEGCSFHAGMGSFEFLPRAKKTYRLETVNTQGMHKTFELPQPVVGIPGLRVRDEKEYLRVMVSGGTDSVGAGDFRLVVHVRGAVLHESRVKRGACSVVMLAKNQCPEGVVQCLLLDGQGKTVSERLCFVGSSDVSKAVKVRMNTDKASYAPHEQIHVGIDLKDDKGMPLKGAFSVSVTDRGFGISDTVFDIRSGLLMASDLAGWVDVPAFYLQATDSTRQAADLLMMTHQWRRYDVADVMKDKLVRPTDMPETGYRIAGRLRFKKPLFPDEHGAVRIQTVKRLLTDTRLDSTGRFSFNLTDAENGEPLILMGLIRKDRAETSRHKENPKKMAVEDAKLDYDNFIGKNFWVELDNPSPTTVAIPQPLLSGNDGRLSNPALMNYYKLGGYYLLPEVLVKASNSQTAYLKELDGDGIRRLQCTNSWELLKKLKVYFVEGKIKYGSISGIGSGEASNMFFYKERPAELNIDAKGYGAGILNFIGPNDMSSIRIYTGTYFFDNNISSQFSTPISGHDGHSGFSKGFLDIELSPSFDYRLLDVFKGWVDRYRIRGPLLSSRIVLNPSDYQRPIRFYSPQYRDSVVFDLPDFRPTIYWNPDLRTDAWGQCGFSFYASDRVTTYDVVIEGVTDTGDVIHEVRKIEIK